MSVAHEIKTMKMMSVATFILSAACVGTAAGFAPANSSTRQSTSLAFFGGGAKKSAAAAASPLATEAVDIYTNKFLSGGSRSKFFFESWGMPGAYSKPDEEKKIFARQSAELTATFNTIASLYGEDNALNMVKVEPRVLAFEKDNFGPSLEKFGDKWGIDEAKEMVIRNPGLLSVKPADAEAADDLTMQLSYVVEVTRPIGKAGPFAIVALLSVPALESATGVTRGELISGLFS